VTVYEKLVGGTGGQASGNGIGGAGGQAIVGSPASGTSNGGTVSVTGVFQGGDGGFGFGGAGPGNGCSETVTNAVTGSTSGSLTLTQNVYGGNGGAEDGFGAFSSGGSATSVLEQSPAGATANLTGTASATGGDGGLGPGHNSTAGAGVATCELSANVSGVVSATANANVDQSDGSATGGSSRFGTGMPGATGQATAGATANTGAAIAAANAVGGAGGFGSGMGNFGGDGGTATAQASASAQSNMQATASATGGNGGAGFNSAAPGTGGSATAIVTAANIFLSDQAAAGTGQQQGAVAFAQFSEGPGGAVNLVIGPGGVNNGQAVVTCSPLPSLGPFTTLQGGGSLQIGSGLEESVVRLTPNSGASAQGALVVEPNSVFDIENNSFFINYGTGADPIGSIVAELQSGFNNGAWNGSGIGTSAPLVVDGLSYGLGYADSADAGNPAGLSSGSIEIKYTLLGDANLDGTVNGIDFGILAANFNKGVSRWDQGDFNYDNAVNGVDFGFLAANFNKGASNASALDDPALVAFAQANGLMADVPEPTGASVFTLLGVLATRRRLWPKRTNPGFGRK
jgi:hypothetical protein